MPLAPYILGCQCCVVCFCSKPFTISQYLLSLSIHTTFSNRLIHNQHLPSNIELGQPPRPSNTSASHPTLRFNSPLNLTTACLPPDNKSHLSRKMPKPSKSLDRTSKRSSSSYKNSSVVLDGRHKRVWKACERCRTRKTKVCHLLLIDEGFLLTSLVRWRVTLQEM